MPKDTTINEAFQQGYTFETKISTINLNKEKGKGKPIVGLNINIWLRLTLSTSLCKNFNY